ncbi:hypothetical protein SB717_27860 [Priestia sp. SIMBA_032]|uniref:hypothetical protein n=1 Tax=Priestia sp. SIMBA_032 TaxID=3085775 RepID=UPI00397B35BC
MKSLLYVFEDEKILLNIPYVFTNAEIRLIQENFNFVDFNLWNNSIFKELKRNVREYLIDLNDEKCFYCKTELNLGTSSIPIEHIIDKSNYPKYTFAPLNLTISCSNCNTCKGKTNVVNNFIHPQSIFYPIDTNNVSIVHAYLDHYEQHIRIEDGIFFVGVTDKGKKTIEVCKLYRCKLAEEKSKELRANMLQSMVKDNDYHLVSTLIKTKNQSLSSQIKVQIVQIIEQYKLVEALENILTTVRQERDLTDIVEIIHSKPEIKDLVEQTTLDDLELINSLLSKSSELEVIKKIINNRNIKTLLKNLLGKNPQGSLDFIIELKEVLNNRTNPKYREIVKEISALFEGNIPEFINEIIDQIIDTGVANKSENILNLIFKVNRNTSIRNNLISLSDGLVERLQDELKDINDLNFSDAQINYIHLLQKMLILRSVFQGRNYKYLQSFKKSLMSIVS